MANKTIAVHLPQDSGNTSLTIRLRTGGTIINTPDTLTETGSTGYFTATVTEANSAGWHSVDILSGATVRYAGGWVYLPGDTAGTYIVDEPQLMRGTDNALLGSGYTAPTNLSAAQVRSELATELARIDAAISTRAVPTDVQLLAVQNVSPTIERVNGDTDAIRFTWPVDSATITGEVSKNGGSYAAVVGAITQRTTEAGIYWYQLAHNAADRTLGSVRYKFTDGTRTRFVNLLVNPATASVDLQPVLDKLPESGRATTAPQVRTELTTELGRIDATISSRSTFAGGAVASVTAPVTVGTNNDKTGYALATAPPTASAIADAVLTESVLDHRNVANSLAKFLWQIRQANLTVDGTVSNAITPTTLTFSSNISATTSAYAHAVLLFITGPLAGENSPIISYNNTNGLFLLEEALTAAPSSGDEFVVIAGSHVHSVADIQSGLALEATLTDIKGAGFATGTDSLKELRDAVDGIEGGGAGDTAEEIVDEIVARGITAIPVQSGVTSSGNLELIQGDTYNGTAKPLLSFPTSANYTDGWTATLTIRDEDDAVIATASGVVVSSTQVTVSLTTPTGLTFTGCPGVWQGKFDVQISKSTQRATIARGIAYVHEDQTRS